MTTKIFLTGQTGFIGSALLNKLKLNDNFKVFNTPKFKEIVSNLYLNEKNKISLEFDNFLRDTDCLIHCAAIANISYLKDKKLSSKLMKVNYEATKLLVKRAVEFGVKRIIFLSSIGVNGNKTDLSGSFSADDIPNPHDDYSVSKSEAEKSLWKISKEMGIEIVVIRAPLVYGKGMKGNFLRLLNLVEKGIPLPFKRVKNLKSFIGLDNLIDLIICCIHHPKAAGKTFLASDADDVSTSDLIIKIAKNMNKKPKLFYVPIYLLKLSGLLLGKLSETNILLGSLRINSSHTYNILGWKPVKSFHEGLKITVKWYLEKK